MDITANYSSGRLTVHLAGELDHHGARLAMRAIEELIDEYMPRDTVLDMAKLSFMDSSGIAVILRAVKRMRETGGRAFVENAGRQPLRVIDASGIDRMVPVKGETRV